MQRRITYRAHRLVWRDTFLRGIKIKNLTGEFALTDIDRLAGTGVYGPQLQSRPRSYRALLKDDGEYSFPGITQSPVIFLISQPGGTPCQSGSPEAGRRLPAGGCRQAA